MVVGPDDGDHVEASGGLHRAVPAEVVPGGLGDLVLLVGVDLVLGRDVALLHPGDRPDAGEGGTAGSGWSDVQAVRELLAGVFERPVTVDMMLCWGQPDGHGRYAARVIPDGGHSEEPLQTLVLHIRRERVGGWT